jgi:AcrR family transcriptional regulator
VRARAEIVEAARDLFARQGYQATTVESIGEATGRSGAAVYQYFSGKFEIFEIFLREVGQELLRVSDQFPVLTDDESGRRALRDWIAHLMEVFDHHAGTFLGWVQIQYSDPELARLGQHNFQRFQTTVLDRLLQARAHPPSPSVGPVGILSVVQWCTLLNARRAVPVDGPPLADALARMLHAYLFAPAAATSAPESDETPIDYHLPTIPLGDELGLRRPVTPRGVSTVQRIMLAAAERFRVNGYRGTSLNAVAARAGVSHGSVYTYWADREALFGTLARDATAAVEAQRLLLPDGEVTGDGIDRWVDGWMSVIDRHGSVLYVWQHEVGGPGLDQLTVERDRAIDAVVEGLLVLSPEPPAEPEAMRVALRALLTDVPFVLSAQLAILTRSDTADFVAQLLRAALGVTRGDPRPPQR